MTRKKACDSCHSKKIQCDGAKPRCDWCAHHDLSCTYERVAPPRKQRVSKAHTAPSQSSAPQDEDIEQRIARLEELFRSSRQDLPGLDTGYPPGSDARPPSEPSSDRLSVIEAWVSSNHAPQPPVNPVATDGVFYGRLWFAGHDLGDISSNSGIPVFSDDGLQWIRERTGEPRPFATLERYFRRPWADQMYAPAAVAAAAARMSQSPGTTTSSASPPARPPDAPRDPRTQLPSQALTERYFSIFCASPLRLIFPMVDEVLFRITIDLAYEPSVEIPPPIDVVGARCSVLAFLAILTLLESEQTAALPVNADQCAALVQDSLLAVINQPTVDGLRAAYMLCMYRDFSGQLQSAAMILSLACRCVFMLGGHLKPQEPMDRDNMDIHQRAQQQIRHIFWLCYFFDKHISLRTGQPPAIDDVQCDLTLPDGYLGINSVAKSSTEEFPPDVKSTLPCLPSDLTLNIIKSRVFTTLYSASALRKSDAHLLRDIRELDAELEQWCMSVAPDVRPSMYRSTRPTDVIVQRDIGMLAIFCHFEYHYLMNTIHQASGRCRGWADPRSPEAVRISLDFSVQAARSSLLHLKAVFHAVHHEAFWLLVFFPMWATVIVFCNVLYNPTADRAREDVELLDSIPTLIKGMRVRQPTPSEVVHLRMLDAFIAEMVRLANCAIDDAMHS